MKMYFGEALRVAEEGHKLKLASQKVYSSLYRGCGGCWLIDEKMRHWWPDKKQINSDEWMALSVEKTC